MAGGAGRVGCQSVHLHRSLPGRGRESKAMSPSCSPFDDECGEREPLETEVSEGSRTVDEPRSHPGAGIFRIHSTSDRRCDTSCPWWFRGSVGCIVKLTQYRRGGVTFGGAETTSFTRRCNHRRFASRLVMAGVDPRAATQRTGSALCESGGIGRRTRLRIWRGNPWGFESPLSHQSAVTARLRSGSRFRATFSNSADAVDPVRFSPAAAAQRRR